MSLFRGERPDLGIFTAEQLYITAIPEGQSSSVLINPTMTVLQGITTSYKGMYSDLIVPASVVGGTQTFKASQARVTMKASSALAEAFGFYGIINNSGAPQAGYGTVGEFINTASAPVVGAFGLMGTYDGVTAVTAAPTATGLFSAAVCGQVWDRNTTGPTAVVLALVNGDTNRQAANHVPAAFRAINRCISFNTGFDYGLDLAIVSPFTRGALVADIRLKTKAEIYTGAAATRNAVRTEVGTQGAVGSIYLSTTAAKMYLKVAIAAADTDWQLVTSSAAD